jgi:hypothetical protein
MKIKVCHLTSVHLAYDIRVFYKECKSLAKAGYEVVLIARHKKDKPGTVDGVQIIPFPPFKNRLFRMLLAPLRMFFLAVKQKAKLYHFHDPELIITGLLLRLFTRAKVVCDIHEDFKTSIRQKYYLSKGIAIVMANLFGFFEATASKFFKLVLAEKYYKERFPKGIHVLNYPISDTSWGNTTFPKENASPQQPGQEEPLTVPGTPGNHQLLYTGVIAEDRGALLHAQLLNYLKDVDLTMVGLAGKVLPNRCDKLPETNRIDFTWKEKRNLSGPPGFITIMKEENGWLAWLFFCLRLTT